MAYKKYICIIAILLCACATKPPEKVIPISMHQSVQDAADAVASQGAEFAIAELEKLAKFDPTSALPWMQVAKIRFEEEKYGQAIVAADEALQRDPENFTAKSIWVIGGLRLARKGILDLQDNAQLAGDAETDASELAKAMQVVLRPSPTPRPPIMKNPVPIPSITPPPKNPVPIPSIPPTTKNPVPESNTDSGGNPFDTLDKLF